jgi:hypothetical protein
MCISSIWIVSDCLLIPKYGDDSDGIILQDRMENDKKFLDLWKIPRKKIYFVFFFKNLILSFDVQIYGFHEKAFYILL